MIDDKIKDYTYYDRPFVHFLKGYFGDKELIDIEIGVDKGINSLQMISKLNIKKLYCIDPYMLDFVYIDSNDHKSKIELHIDINKRNELISQSYDECKRNLYDKYNNVIHIKRFSSKAIRSIKESNLDFVYIDGDHSYRTVELDIKLYKKKLSKDGIIGGDDYMKNGVNQAVNEMIPREKLHVMNYDVLRKGKKETNTEWWVVND